MYAGPFNQNTWLRTFVRGDLVDEYERKCRIIVNEYEGISTTRSTLKSISRRLGKELDNLFEKCSDLKEKRQRGDMDVKT